MIGILIKTRCWLLFQTSRKAGEGYEWKLRAQLGKQICFDQVSQLLFFYLLHRVRFTLHFRFMSSFPCRLKKSRDTHPNKPHNKATRTVHVFFMRTFVNISLLTQNQTHFLVFLMLILLYSFLQPRALLICHQPFHSVVIKNTCLQRYFPIKTLTWGASVAHLAWPVFCHSIGWRRTGQNKSLKTQNPTLETLKKRMYEVFYCCTLAWIAKNL